MTRLPREICFEDVDIRTCYVLAWEYSDRRLVMDLEVSLLKSHPEYQKPSRGHILDLRRGDLTFREIKSITGLLDQDDVTVFPGHDGELDTYDEVHFLCSDDMETFYFEGEFGEVWLVAETPQIRLVESGWTASASPQQVKD